MRRRSIGPALAGLLLLALVACSEEEPTRVPGPPTVTADAGPPPSATTGGTDRPRVVETVASGLSVPWGLAFLPNGDAVVTERDNGRVLLLSGPDHTLRDLGTLDETRPQGEAGLLGVAVSPDFETDRRLFFYLTTDEDNRIVSATYDDGRLGATTPVLTGIPNGFIHDGGRLAFGPDGHLYASTGEIGEPELAQDLDSLGGKILRITPEGEPAPGNPFEDSPVWSYGHRNVQGLAFDDEGRLWASEFGAQDFDELNLIEPGDNYGWPTVEGNGDREGLVDPQVVWSTDTASPSGLAFLDGRLWLAALRGERLWRIDVDDTGTATSPADFLGGEYGRLRTVAVAPDGRLWLTTSNRDGRGNPAADDDRILVIDPR
ncbi:sorbosone dehydrogenase family protein [Nocardioides sp.]|uniref:PQQ-dependent sugar dehydrogenase n=1 Tax=Nocardioides sp. TaxID=35761 RepID=UPI003569D722